jgi:N-methylhydantoinase A
MTSGTTSYRVAVDVGGTFTDFVLLDESTGEVSIEKVPSLPDELPRQFLLGLRSLDVPIGDLRQIFHGMTVGVNALVQDEGAKVGLITTKGFRDVLEMGRGGREPVYDFVQRLPAPLIERYLRREVTERSTATGEILVPLDVAELDEQIDYLIRRGIEALAIVFLHAYAGPSHELLAKERIEQRYPELAISVSHEIAAEWREYERTSTTVLNAALQPTIRNYIRELRSELTQAGYTRPLAIMQSSGGVVDAITARNKPIRTLMSGPAGGVIGAKVLCDRLGHKNVISTDVGGTTYDVAIIEDGRILERSQTEIAGRPVLGTLIDVISIGAGGGSIAWLDHRNGLQVGPRSAGASPGPACFGRGGADPTVTDAHLVLGRLDPDYFLGGRMRLEAAAAHAAIDASIAAPLGLSTLAAAQGIVSIAETNMANAIRTKTVERGLDPREFVLMAFGGGGGLFACSVAAELGVGRVIVPCAPANFSAWGILASDYTEDEVRTKVMPFDDEHLPEALHAMREIMGRAMDSIEDYGFSRDKIERLARFDIRFENQEYTITIDLDPAWEAPEAILDGARRRFVAAHRKLYGHGDLDSRLELVSVRCRAIGRVQPPRMRPQSVAKATSERCRSVYFAGAGAKIETRVVGRESLRPNIVIQGPLIIDEWTMTTVVPPGWQAAADDLGNLILIPIMASPITSPTRQ